MSEVKKVLVGSTVKKTITWSLDPNEYYTMDNDTTVENLSIQDRLIDSNNEVKQEERKEDTIDNMDVFDPVIRVEHRVMWESKEEAEKEIKKIIKENIKTINENVDKNDQAALRRSQIRHFNACGSFPC